MTGTVWGTASCLGEQSRSHCPRSFPAAKTAKKKKKKHTAVVVVTREVQERELAAGAVVAETLVSAGSVMEYESPTDSSSLSAICLSRGPPFQNSLASSHTHRVACFSSFWVLSPGVLQVLLSIRQMILPEVWGERGCCQIEKGVTLSPAACLFACSPAPIISQRRE